MSTDHSEAADRPVFSGAPSQEVIDRVNSTLNYAMWAVFSCDTLAEDGLEATVAGIEEKVAASGATVRGYYDVSGFRADADLMVWLRADNSEALQEAYRTFRRSALGLTPVWSVVGLHRPAEFNKSHLPGFLIAERTPKYAAVYPFIRSYDWYLLDDWKRNAIMKNHAAAGREFGDLITSTLATFSLSDYEWIVSAEGDRLERLVDLQNTFRHTEARMHVRQDTPFYTGVKTELIDWARNQLAR